MPPKKSYKKKARKNQRDYYALKKMVSLQNSGVTNYQGFVSGLPKMRRAKMRYNETFTATSTGGFLDLIKFRANGIWDPNLTGSGHQPFGYDTWATQYNHCVVVSSKISAMAYTNSLNVPAMFGIYLNDDTQIPYTTPSSLIEARKGTSKPLQLRVGQMPVTTSSYSAKRFFNLKDVKDNVDRVGSLVGDNPSEQALFNVWFATLDGSTSTIYMNVTIDYTVEFSEPKDLPVS